MQHGKIKYKGREITVHLRQRLPGKDSGMRAGITWTIMIDGERHHEHHHEHQEIASNNEEEAYNDHRRNWI